MKFITIAVILFGLLFCSCSSGEKKEDFVIKEDWPVDTTTTKYAIPYTDTVLWEKEVSMYNDPYSLKIYGYNFSSSSLKDKALDRKLPEYTADIILIKEQDTLISAHITKNTFADSLRVWKYNKAILHDVKYESVRSNRLYFIATVGIPGTEQPRPIGFAIFYQTEKRGRLDYWSGNSSVIKKAITKRNDLF